MVRSVWSGDVRRGMAMQARRGPVLRGVSRCGQVMQCRHSGTGSGAAGLCMTRHGIAGGVRYGSTWSGVSRYGLYGLDEQAWRGKVCCGDAQHGVAWYDNVMQAW